MSYLILFLVTRQEDETSLAVVMTHISRRDILGNPVVNNEEEVFGVTS